jgi:hypothetical protein
MVAVSAVALEEIEPAYDWLYDESPQHAPVWKAHLLDALLTLEIFPNRAPLAAESDESPVPVRQLLYGDKRYAYRIL